MNYVRLLTRVGDIADAVSASANRQTHICESATRLLRANQTEDARNLLAMAVGMSEANERVLAVIRDIFAEIEREGIDRVEVVE